jgi:hypothetical protein
MAAKDETVVCAALKYGELVIPCIRHFDNIAGSLLDALGAPDNADIEQGFLTSHRRFLTREKAKELAILRGQVEDNNDIMFSEDLY